MNCGAELDRKKSTKTPKKPPEKQQRFDSYSIIGAAFIFSLLVILLIYNSNTENLKEKTLSTQASGQNPAMSDNQPPMEVMQRIQSLKENLEKNPDAYDANVQLANAYFDIGRFDNAVLYYKNALAIRADQPDVLIDMAVSYFNINEPNPALEYVEAALFIDPNHILGLYNAGIIYYNLNRVDDAVAVWERLILKHPKSQEATKAKEHIESIKNQLTNS